MQKSTSTLLALAFTASLASAQGQLDRLRITVENLAPTQSNTFTPFWIGFHDGSFDLYDGGAPIVGPMAPLANNALEALVEDGNNGPVSQEFLAAGQLVDFTVPGPNGPIAPGDFAGMSVLIDPDLPTSRYLSYASMVLPSNDAFIANGDPLEAPVYDAAGNFVFLNAYETGQQYLDGGTEVNDELPANTAFFGQMAPNTGVDENGVVMPHPGFLDAGSGGILDDPRFQEATFRDPGFPGVKIRIERQPAIVGFRGFGTILSGGAEVPPISTPANGLGALFLTDGGTQVRFLFIFDNLENVIGAHLHYAPVGENGPIVANLIEPGDADPFNLAPGGGSINSISGVFDAAALAGPLANQPLEALVQAFYQGQIYVNVHTSDGDDNTSMQPGDFMSGELRGQAFRL